ncbi:MAG: hypothetical protein AB7I33_03055 [Gemmatimonadales bacterium]
MADAQVQRPAASLEAQDEGIQRVPFLPLAHMVTLAPTAGADDPVSVAIFWDRDRIELPFPGSVLWRAALARWLELAPAERPADTTLREQVERSLARYPTAESWWAWVSSGWTAPPAVDASDRRHAGRGSLLRRLWRRVNGG